MRNLTKAFVREKKIYCGSSYLEVDIFPHCGNQKKDGRKSRKNETPPKIKNLNDKNARRYFVQLVNTNFTDGDYFITLTYNAEHLPCSIEDAEHETKKFIRRVAYCKKKQGLPPSRYVLVTETETKSLKQRIHHHIIMDGNLPRSKIEDIWTKNNQKMGFVKVERLQNPAGNGYTGLAKYLMKEPSRHRRWTASLNLKKPYSRTNDSRYGKRQLEKIAKTQPDADFWKKKYPGYRIIKDFGYTTEYHEGTGWHIYLKLIREEKVKC